jgi:transcriptional regulator with XRE-family HTH domain
MTKEVLLKKIGKHVVTLREKQGISQSDLARLCGKDRQGIHRFENGDFNPSIFYLSEIAKALNVTLSELVNIQ